MFPLVKMIWVHFISVGGSPKKREGWGMYIPHPSLFFGRFNSFETHPFEIEGGGRKDIGTDEVKGGANRVGLPSEKRGAMNRNSLPDTIR
jgi:hypothetical protein